MMPMIRLMILVLALCIAMTGTAFGSGEAAGMNEDMVQAAEYLAGRIESACAEHPEIVRLRIDLGLFHAHQVEGVTAQGGAVTVYDVYEDFDGGHILDQAWCNHLRDRTYYADFEALVAQKLGEKQCPPYEFIHPEGQTGRLLELRESLYDAIGGKTEISEVLEAILPIWTEIGQGKYDPDRNEAGIDKWTAGKPFTITWTFQEQDEESDEYYQLKVELEYAPDAENSRILEDDWLNGNDDFRSAVLGTKAYQWAEGKQAARVSVYISGT